MKKIIYVFSFLITGSFNLLSQETSESKREPGHINNNKFKQLYEEFSSPNRYRTASGAPGSDYYQQQVDYIMDLELDDKNTKLYGEETITYTNNSPDNLDYLWIQLDQNIRKKDAPALEKNGGGADPLIPVEVFASKYFDEPFDGGFNINWVKSSSGIPLKYTINNTMMRVDLPSSIKSGESYSFKIKWWYNINNHVTNRARSGYEFFSKDGNRAYVIAQFFPRLAVYNDLYIDVAHLEIFPVYRC